jgi:hypothetical protein
MLGISSQATELDPQEIRDEATAKHLHTGFIHCKSERVKLQYFCGHIFHALFSLLFLWITRRQSTAMALFVPPLYS